MQQPRPACCKLSMRIGVDDALANAFFSATAKVLSLLGPVSTQIALQPGLAGTGKQHVLHVFGDSRGFAPIDAGFFAIAIRML